MSEDTVVYGESQGFCDAAIAYARLGFHVFPLVPNGKTPLIAGGFKAATTNTAQITAWWAATPRANIGIATGESGLVVIDLDVKGGRNGVEAWQDLCDQHGVDVSTWLVETPTGGIHCYFKGNGHDDIASSAGKLGKGIDVRANGGYVVAPPSVVNGTEYRWLQDLAPGSGPLADLPDALVPLLRGSNGNGNVIVPKPPAAVDGDVPEGERNDTVARWVGKKLAEGVPPAQAFEMAKLFNEARCKPPLPDKEVNTIVRSIVKKDMAGKAMIAPKPKADDDSVEIDVDEETRVTSQLVWAALAKKALGRNLFVYQGTPIRIGNDGHNMFLRPLTGIRLYSEVNNLVWTYRMVKQGRDEVKKHVHLPPCGSLMAAIGGAEATRTGLPTVERIVSHPCFMQDGEIIKESGYHEKSRTYAFFNLRVPEIPQTPSADDMAKAKDWVDGLIHDFPFMSNADRTNAIAMFLLPFARHMINGPTPLHFVSATDKGSGKTLLAELTAAVAIGGSAEALDPEEGGAEFRKSVTSALLVGKDILFFDNLNLKVKTKKLLEALTTWPDWTDRRLGTNDRISAPLTCCWLATGINPTLSEEMVRRTIVIRLDPNIEDPWLRDNSNFHHPDILSWIKENRPNLIWAFMTLIQSWIASGRPKYTKKPLGKFEDWHYMVEGILVNAGYSDFFANFGEVREKVDVDGDSWRAFVKLWQENFGLGNVTVEKLYPLAVECDLATSTGKDEAAKHKALGWKLSKHDGVVYGGLKIVRGKRTKGRLLYRLRNIDNNPQIPF